MSKPVIDALGALQVTKEQWETLGRTDRPLRWGFWLLVVGLGLLLAWAIWAPLGQGVPASGSVVIETRRKTIQHPSGGVVMAVRVREGQQVSQGEVLIEINDTQARAALESARQTYFGQLATQARLAAEQHMAAAVTFPQELLLLQEEPWARDLVLAQRTLFATRRASFTAELAAMQQSLQSTRLQLDGVEKSLQTKQQQAQLQARQLQSVQTLSAEGFAPRNQVLQMEQSQLDLRAAVEDLKVLRERLQTSISEVGLRMEVQRQNQFKDIGAQLADVQRELRVSRERLLVAQEELERTQLRAPVAGQVVGLTVTDTGGVISAGQRLMDVVPQGESLLIDARIPPHIIDRVQAGQAVDIRFATFANTPQLVVPGHIVSLSGDALSDPAGFQSNSGTYYLARVAVDPQGHQILGARTLRPGMPVEVLVRVGERSLLQYLLHPLVKRMAASMKEE